MLIHAIVVAGDDAGADVHPFTHLGVAHVGEMVGLAVTAEPAFLHFHEIADVHFIGKLALRPDARERSYPHPRTDAGALQHAVGEHFGVVADLAIADDRVGADAHPVAEFHLAFEHAVDVDAHITAAAQLAAHVDARRVPQHHALLHEPIRKALPERRFSGSQLFTVVDTGHFAFLRCRHAIDQHALRRRHGDDVGEVILLLGIVVTQLREPAAQQPRLAGHQAGIDLVDAALLRAGILVLHDTLHLALGIAQYAAVTRGLRDPGGEHRQFAAAGGIGQSPQGPGTHQRYIAVQHQHGVIVGDGGQGLHERMTGAQLLRLQHPLHPRLFECGGHLVAAVAVHHMDRGGFERRRGMQHMFEQRLAAQRLQHLGQIGIHPLALACGQDDDA